MVYMQTPTREGFLVTVQGQYFARAQGEIKGKILKDYKIQVILPSAERALSIIKHKVLGRKLPKVYPDYISYRTHTIVEIKDLSGRTKTSKLNMMSKGDIADYVQKANLPVQVETYEDILELRQAVVDCETDLEGFLKRDTRRLEDRKLDQTLLQLNPDLRDEVKTEDCTDESADQQKPDLG